MVLAGRNRKKVKSGKLCRGKNIGTVLTAKKALTVQKFHAADILIPLFINNVHVDTCESDIISYIKSKTNITVKLQKIKSKQTKDYSSYKDFERGARFFSHLTVVVDTYFMMSGLLLMKNFKPETRRPISPFKIILKRYFRLIWLFIIIILIVITATPYLQGGPLWFKFAKTEHDVCKKNWWLGLLMLGNYIDSQNICMVNTWYVPADYHLAVVSTMMYWLYQKNRRGGQLLFGLITIVSLFLPGIYTYLNRLPATTLFNFETIEDYRKYIIGSPMYVQSHWRASSYFVGLIAGYILSVYKPAGYRNFISMKYSILSFIAIMALCATIFIMGSAYQFREYNAIESALFAALNRPIWAALIAAFILLCEYGTLPLIPDFLSWSAFVPLSKLSYGIYICHLFFVIRLTLSLRTPAWYDAMKLILESMVVVVITGLLSLYIALFIESPLNNLVAVILKTKSDKMKKVNSEKNEMAPFISDSFKENSIKNMATVEEIGYVSAAKKNPALSNSVDINGYSSQDYDRTNKYIVKKQNFTTKEEV